MLRLGLQFVEVAVILNLAAVAALASRAQFTSASQAIAVGHNPVTLRIRANESSTQFVAALERPRVIRSATAFRALAGIQLASRSFHAAVYHVVRHLGIAQVLATLPTPQQVASDAATLAPAVR